MASPSQTLCKTWTQTVLPPSLSLSLFFSSILYANCHDQGYRASPKTSGLTLTRSAMKKKISSPKGAVYDPFTFEDESTLTMFTLGHLYARPPKRLARQKLVLCTSSLSQQLLGPTCSLPISTHRGHFPPPFQ